jgi:hypothetical protein
MAEKGFTDTDKGMKKALEEMKKLSRMYIASGFPEGSGTTKIKTGKKNKEVTIAQIASWNENGTYNKDGSQHIPARPFMSQAVDNNEARIIKTGEKIVKKIINGKIDANTAIRQCAENMNALIKETIRNGDFAPNSEVTIHGLGVSGGARKKGEKWLRSKKSKKEIIKGKKSSHPLIHTGLMRNSVQSVIVDNNAVIERVKSSKLH